MRISISRDKKLPPTGDTLLITPAIITRWGEGHIHVICALADWSVLKEKCAPIFVYANTLIVKNVLFIVFFLFTSTTVHPLNWHTHYGVGQQNVICIPPLNKCSDGTFHLPLLPIRYCSCGWVAQQHHFQRTKHAVCGWMDKKLFCINPPHIYS